MQPHEQRTRIPRRCATTQVMYTSGGVYSGGARAIERSISANTARCSILMQAACHTPIFWRLFPKLTAWNDRSVDRSASDASRREKIMNNDEWFPRISTIHGSWRDKNRRKMISDAFRFHLMQNAIWLSEEAVNKGIIQSTIIRRLNRAFCGRCTGTAHWKHFLSNK